jgi:hypothetical protein
MEAEEELNAIWRMKENKPVEAKFYGGSNSNYNLRKRWSAPDQISNS